MTRITDQAGGTGFVHRSLWCQQSVGCEKHRDAVGRRREIFSGPPDIAWSTFFSDSSHHVVSHGRFFIDAGGLALQPVIEPANHVLMFGPRRIFRIREFRDFEALVETSVEPWPNDQLLLAARVLATVMLPSLKTGDGSLVHKVVPASNGEARNVHLCEMERTVFVLPIVIEVRMSQPFLKQPIVVFGIATVSRQ